MAQLEFRHMRGEYTKYIEYNDNQLNTFKAVHIEKANRLSLKAELNDNGGLEGTFLRCEESTHLV